MSETVIYTLLFYIVCTLGMAVFSTISYIRNIRDDDNDSFDTSVTNIIIRSVGWPILAVILITGFIFILFDSLINKIPYIKQINNKSNSDSSISTYVTRMTDTVISQSKQYSRGFYSYTDELKDGVLNEFFGQIFNTAKLHINENAVKVMSDSDNFNTQVNLLTDAEHWDTFQEIADLDVSFDTLAKLQKYLDANSLEFTRSIPKTKIDEGEFN